MSQSPKSSTIAILFFFEGSSIREIAGLYSLSELQVEDFLRAALMENKSQKKETSLNSEYTAYEIPF